MAGKYAQFEQYVLFFEDFCFITSLYEFLNEKNEVKNSLFNGHIEFEFSYSYFKNKFLRKLEFYAKNSCGVVCQSDNECDGHKTLNYLKRYEEFMVHMVEDEKIFYKNMYVVKDGKNTDAMMGYIFIPKDVVNLKDKSWSQRMAFLN